MSLNQHDGPPAGDDRAINLPPWTLRLIVLLLAIHAGRLLLPVVDDDWLIATFSIVPARYLGDMPADFLDLAAGPLGHMFLHADWMHVGMNVATLAAFGAPVERFLGGPRYLGFYVVTGLIGAALHVAVTPASQVPMIGASGAISGLFGGLLLIMYVSGRMRSIVPFTLVWLAMQVGLGYYATTPGGDGIAWAAHIGGFAAGMALIRPFAGWRW
ncbi:MAG: rhomboid family intramembrane serine protease [Rhodospirillales bacterium]|nr:rhomboid family intramembrane serine protease [Rhodospirillales bacterium]QQS11404.1 MAG: rhomboid family intramembrane serine protease [Rhodospirillales bacterium]